MVAVRVRGSLRYALWQAHHERLGELGAGISADGGLEVGGWWFDSILRGLRTGPHSTSSGQAHYERVGEPGMGLRGRRAGLRRRPLYRALNRGTT